MSIKFFRAVRVIYDKLATFVEAVQGAYEDTCARWGRR